MSRSSTNSTPTRPGLALNDALLCVVFAISALQFGLFPLLFRPTLPRELTLIAIVAISSPLHWGLAHESFHGNFSKDTAANRRVGRLLTSLIFMSWDMVRFGHLMHHDSNRHTLDRPEVLPPGSSWAAGAAAYFTKLMGGHAVLAALASLGVLLPVRATRWIIDRVGQDSELAKIQSAALRSFTNADRRSRIRMDLAVSAGLIAVACWCWGPLWPVFAASVAARFFMLSVLDNSHHYGTSLDSGPSARNTWLPRWASVLILNQNLHGVHHGAPDLSWRELRRNFAGAGYNGSWFGCVLRQFRGPMRADQLTRT